MVVLLPHFLVNQDILKVCQKGGIPVSWEWHIGRRMIKNEGKQIR